MGVFFNRFYLALLVLAMFAAPGFSQLSDYQLLKSINQTPNTGLDNAATFISNTSSAIDFAAPAGMFVVGLTKHDSALLQKSYIAAFALAATTVEEVLLKKIVGRARPAVTHPDIRALENETSASFPSGHTSASFATAASLSLAFPKWYVIAPSFAWASAVGYSRMRMGVHYPSDVLAGAILGAGTSYLTYKGNQWLRAKRKKPLSEPGF